ncbi:hypothetical protein EBO34_13320 [Alteribacter keqinensis]|uniref:Uncharacterized protein n=1 Tax=Alteribacter keqinensis TaxID=2483800 RepID=A0A3M7TPX9_9BACI|nr:hypothetical protein EBO34_13320 [Alteribacter keqinensis]
MLQQWDRVPGSPIYPLCSLFRSKFRELKDVLLTVHLSAALQVIVTGLGDHGDIRRRFSGDHKQAAFL